MRGTSIAGALVASLFVFAVACDDDDDPTGPTTGSVEVTVATTGGTDPDGYSVSVDGGTGVPITANGTIVIPGVAAGTRSVELGGLDAACAVSGSNPATVTVVAGDTASTSFSVACTAAATGTIVVTTTTGGLGSDADGYLVDTNGDTLAAAVNDTVSFADLPAGDYDVTISGVDANCSVNDTTTVAATLVGDDTANVDFAIECAALSASLSGIESGEGTLAVAPERQLERLLALSGS